MAGAALLAAITHNNCREVVKILEEGFYGRRVDVNDTTIGPHKSTLLMAACTAAGREGIVEAILTRRAADIDVNVVDERGMTALRCAVIHNNPEIVALLMQREELRVDRPSGWGITALHDVGLTNNAHVAKMLLQRADVFVNVPDGNGWTAFYLAAMSDSADVVRVFLQRKGTNVHRGENSAVFGEQRPVHCAVKLNSVHMTNLFFKYASRVRRSTHKWCTYRSTTGGGTVRDRRERGGWRGRRGVWVQRGGAAFRF